MRRCRAPRTGLLLEATAGGDGVLLWLRSDSLPHGVFPILGVRDTVTARGAIVAVRYMTGELGHGYALDSGSVSTQDSAGTLTLRVAGSGLETPGGFRPFLDATLERVTIPVPGDTISCDPLR